MTYLIGDIDLIKSFNDGLGLMNESSLTAVVQRSFLCSFIYSLILSIQVANHI